MEDQLMALKALNVPAAMFSATSTKEEVNSIQDVRIFYKFQNGTNLVAVLSILMS
jgi:hypothetical protein